MQELITAVQYATGNLEHLPYALPALCTLPMLLVGLGLLLATRGHRA